MPCSKFALVLGFTGRGSGLCRTSPDGLGACQWRLGRLEETFLAIFADEGHYGGSKQGDLRPSQSIDKSANVEMGSIVA